MKNVERKKIAKTITKTIRKNEKNRYIQDFHEQNY